MDRKTLEYMTDRTKKATVIVNKIDELSKQAERLINAEEIKFSWRDNGVTLDSVGYSGRRASARVVANIKTFAVEAINEEIQQLEEELAAL
ncbi:MULTISPECIES: hypothetical protein [Paenibacillus]|jgi:GTP-binding protein EngB required for normal cell division|uniref:GTPase HflX n=1 Tax=Paenibacillus odorifer TaxID=189426 RepID=A0ABX3GQ69_9BACL|nr:hypothetical protein [Paenibacillus odorifer]OMD34635.1 hypothetical protein BSO21_10740 [Paenibacillus odorifer]OME29381.1 hypothetical protein BSK63_21770 [Paenibacillus odorifer]